MNPNTEYLNKTPNRSDRNPAPWVGVVWHGTGGNPANPHGTLKYNLSAKIKSSYHDLIAADGTWFQYLDPSVYTAWHAGISAWRIHGTLYTNYQINEKFIGVELDETNKGTPAPSAQMEAAARLALYYRDEYGIPLEEPYHVTHKAIAPGRKIDPTCTTVATILTLARQLDRITPTDTYEQAWGPAAPYNADWGIPSLWRREIDEGRDPGAILGREQDFYGRTIQAAQRALFVHHDGVTEVVRL